MEDRYRLSVEVKMRLTQDTGSKICNRYEKLQQYQEGFAVYKIEDPSEYTVDEEEEMFYLVICAENAPEGITVTATLVDENWEPVQE